MPAVRGARIHWQSSMQSNGHVGIIDPITDTDPVYPKLQKPSSYPPQPLDYPMPASLAQLERSARDKASKGGIESEFSATKSARKIGLSHSATLESPAFKNTSVTTSSFPKPSSPVKTTACNFGDPNRRHNPHGTRDSEGTMMTSEILPNGAAVNITRS